MSLEPDLTIVECAAAGECRSALRRKIALSVVGAFLVTGVLGPQANAHGPNEFMHIPTGKPVTSCVATVIADHFSRC